jgi:hypothetical protein
MGGKQKIWWIAALSAVVVLAVGFFIFDEPLEFWLDCNRTTGVCTFTQKLLGRSRIRTAPLASLRAAELRTGTPRRSVPRVSVWVVGQGQDLFFADYHQRADAEATAGEINTYLKDPTRLRFRITRVDKTMYGIAWAFVPLVALFVVALASALSSKKTAAAGQAAEPPPS